MQDLEELYQLYSPDIYRYLCGLTHNPVWAEDLLSETFLKAVRAFGRFEGRSSIKTWLFTIARNVWVDALRRKRPTLSYDDMLAGYLEQDMPDPRGLEEECDTRDLARRARQLLETCKPNARTVLLMRAQGYSFAEIAQACGITENSARMLSFRTRNWLRDQLKQEEGSMQ